MENRPQAHQSYMEGERTALPCFFRDKTMGDFFGHNGWGKTFGYVVV
jgi:hypothetical protein